MQLFSVHPQVSLQLKRGCARTPSASALVLSGTGKIPESPQAANNVRHAGGLSADILARKHAAEGACSMEIRVAVIGNVDSGKSTMVGVLTRSILDDGRGFARSKVFKHGHEEATGRTSSIGQHNLCVSLSAHPC